ncbi:MAG TPA: PASTA domain-containing protein, partial [Microbacterium sp.]|nr:PASTA domain-containing protein [Microbacterium sp.]
VFQSRFIQEARAAARLADPNVVTVFDQGQDGDMAYLVMEYLPGITLRELMREQRRLTITQTITIMDAVLSGLAAAHRAGIVHRDVKPENVLLAEDGRIKIGDFGLARATTANTATGQQLLGTIAYLAPELVTRGTADARSDIYALGIMLYEMLVGEQPYKGEQPMQIAYQHATDSVPRPSVKNPSVPEPLDELVLWATEKSPDERPNDAQQMLDRLREIERELGVTPIVSRTAATAAIPTLEDGASGELTKVLPSSVTGPAAIIGDADNATLLRRRTQKRSRRGGWLVAIVLLLAALAAGIGWWLGSGPGSLVAVPDVSNIGFADAQQVLADESLVAVQQDVYDIDVAPGLVVGTDPPAGSRLDKNATVTVLVSQGPQPHDVEALSGRQAADARGVLQGLNLTVADPDQEFFTDAEAGTVIGVSVAPRAGGDAVDCTQGCTALEGDTATLSVSVGPVPDVFGETVDSATAILAEKNLSVSGTYEEFRDDVEAGLVVYIADREGGGDWRPGDSVTLAVSKGPEPIEVPNVVGLTRDEAKARITDAGFAFEYNTLWDVILDAATQVEAQDPEGGEFAERGSTISLRITGSF